MQIIKSIQAMQERSDAIRSSGKSIGFVPTMGYLHEGHLSLIKMARQHADVIVMSIFVNPIQFGPAEDFEKYPRDIQHDETLAKNSGVDILFYPAEKIMYPKPYLTYVHVDDITSRLCGLSRPDHFQGVTTVCAKLFHIVKPHAAIFGQKDAQQAAVIQKMVNDLNFGFQVIIAPVFREPDGLAMSSRNVYLSKEERNQALVLHRSLQHAESRISQGEFNTDVIKDEIKEHINAEPLARIDYIEIVAYSSMVPVKMIKGRVLIALAVYFGKTRLIDNVIVDLGDDVI